jgi:RND family efflux transporter MFP subunit
VSVENKDLSGLRIEKSRDEPTKKRDRKRIYLFAALLLALIATFFLMRGCLSPSLKVEVARVAKVYPSQSFSVLNSSGYVVAQRRAAVSSKITSRLTELYVEEGSRVKEGQIIAKLEGRDAEASRDQAKANLNVALHTLEQAQAELIDARRSFERNKELIERGFIARAEFDASEARFRKASAGVEAAEAQVRAARAALRGGEVSVEYALIRAPFDGVVLTKNADVGDIVTPIGAAADARSAVVTMADPDSLQVETDVSEANVQKVQVGQPCEIQLDAIPDDRFAGVVHMIVPTADRTKATVLVKVRFLEMAPRILPEMSAKVSFLSRPLKPGEDKPRTAVPKTALILREGRPVVFVVEDGRVRERSVETGESFGDMVEVVSGVAAGERVASTQTERLKDGRKVEVTE